MIFLSLLGTAWTDLAGKFPDGKLDWVDDLFNTLYPMLYAIMAVVGAAGLVYAIVLGVNLAKADEQSKRDEAKKRLITTIVAVAVVVGLVIFFNELLPMILGAFIKEEDFVTTTETGKNIALNLASVFK